MPSITRISGQNDGLAMWNIERRVGGFRGATRGLDVKLVQFLLYAYAKRSKQTGPGSLTIQGVDGVWGPRSSAALARFVAHMNSYGARFSVTDGACDPIKSEWFTLNGNRYRYNLISLQLAYAAAKNGTHLWFTPLEIVQKNIMELPEGEPDMPKDLMHKLTELRQIGGGAVGMLAQALG